MSNIKIKSHHVKITKALKDYAETKMEKLDRFFDQIHSVTVSLDFLSSSSQADRYVVSVIVVTNTNMIKAKDISDDMYGSIDKVLDKLEIQLKRHKEKLRNHKRPTSMKMPLEEKKVIKSDPVTERYIKKPMNPEDALCIIEEERLNFLVFKDMSEKICVIFPKGENEFGLITT